MAEVSIDGGDLRVAVRGARRFATLTGELRIPLENVRGVTADPELSTRWPGLSRLSQWPGQKVRGTDLYGHYLGGVFRQDGEMVFWDVADPAKAVVITLFQGDFTRLYVEVDDPEGVVAMVESVLEGGGGAL